MSTHETIIDERFRSAREVMAGHAASVVWLRELSAAHLLDTQHPIRDIPVPAPVPAAGHRPGAGD